MKTNDFSKLGAMLGNMPNENNNIAYFLHVYRQAKNTYYIYLILKYKEYSFDVFIKNTSTLEKEYGKNMTKGTSIDIPMNVSEAISILQFGVEKCQTFRLDRFIDKYTEEPKIKYPKGITLRDELYSAILIAEYNEADESGYEYKDVIEDDFTKILYPESYNIDYNGKIFKGLDKIEKFKKWYEKRYAFWIQRRGNSIYINIAKEVYHAKHCQSEEYLKELDLYKESVKKAEEVYNIFVSDSIFNNLI